MWTFVCFWRYLLVFHKYQQVLLHGVKASVEGSTRSGSILWLPPCVTPSSGKIPSSSLYLALKPMPQNLAGQTDWKLEWQTPNKTHVNHRSQLWFYWSSAPKHSILLYNRFYQLFPKWHHIWVLNSAFTVTLQSLVLFRFCPHSCRTTTTSTVLNAYVPTITLCSRWWCTWESCILYAS
jgi:hypothetical protein